MSYVMCSMSHLTLSLSTSQPGILTCAGGTSNLGKQVQLGIYKEAEEGREKEEPLF